MADEAPIATEVIYEDEKVRVWRQHVPAGGEIPKHRHDNDYCLVNIAGVGPIDVEFHEGTGGAAGDKATFSPKPGTANLVRAGHIETAYNRGEDYDAILVEFL